MCYDPFWGKRAGRREGAREGDDVPRGQVRTAAKQGQTALATYALRPRQPIKAARRGELAAPSKRLIGRTSGTLVVPERTRATAKPSSSTKFRATHRLFRQSSRLARRRRPKRATRASGASHASKRSEPREQAERATRASGQSEPREQAAKASHASKRQPTTNQKKMPPLSRGDIFSHIKLTLI